MHVMLKWKSKGTLQVLKLNLLREGAQEKATETLEWMHSEGIEPYKILIKTKYQWRTVTKEHFMVLLDYYMERYTEFCVTPWYSLREQTYCDVDIHHSYLRLRKCAAMPSYELEIQNNELLIVEQIQWDVL
jgi:hypothetical protein